MSRMERSKISRITVFRIILSAFFIFSISLSLYLTYRIYELWENRIIITPYESFTAKVKEEMDMLEMPGMVLDEVVGWRPKSNVAIKGTMHAIDKQFSQKYERHHNNFGLIRQEDAVGDIEQSPVVLLIGDSHMQGVVSTHENASAVLEGLLRDKGGYKQALVINGSCGMYSLYQYALRVKTLAPLVKPDLIIIVAFIGNDFLELEDLSRPHLNDYCKEVLANRGSTSFVAGGVERFNKLALPEDVNALFNQGLNQSVYLMEHPEREDVIVKKARKCVRLLKSIAGQYDSSLLFVLLPSYDMVFPEQAMKMSAYARKATANRGNMCLLGHMKNILCEESCNVVNLLPVFIESRRPFLYAGDFHIWQEGHKLIADSIYENVVEIIERIFPRVG